MISSEGVPAADTASARHRSPHGMVSISWVLVDGTLTVETELPTGTTGVLDLDGEPRSHWAPAKHRRTVTIATAAAP